MFSGSELNSGSSGGTVLQKTNSKNPIISSRERQDWISIRKRAGDDQTRLYAILGAGEWEVAIQQAKLLLKKQPKNYAGLHVLATSLAMQGDYNLASFYAGLIRRFYPSRKETKNIEALAILNQGKSNITDIRRAIKLFTEAMDGSKSEFAAGLNLGNLYFRIGSSHLALQVFQRTYKRCRCLAALQGVGASQARLGKYEVAMGTFKEVLKMSPKNQVAYYWLAQIENNGFQNPSSAKLYLSQIIEGDGESSGIKRSANFLLRKIEGEEIEDKNIEYTTTTELDEAEESEME